MRIIASLFSALALSFLLIAQAPPAAKSGTAAKKAPVKKATTAKKAATPAAAAAPAAGELNTDENKTLYAIGMYFNDLQKKQLDTLELSPAELAIVRKGYLDALNGNPAIKLDEWGPKINQFAGDRQAKIAEKSLGPEKARGAEYTAKAAAESGAQKLASGIVYQELKAGDGANPTADNVVRVHYKGTLIDGKEFDSSYSRNEPAEFPLTGVIPCWTEGVQKIKVHGKAKLVCPSDRAYGDQGRPPQIPGGATLVFEVELLDIVKQEAATPPQN